MASSTTDSHTEKTLKFLAVEYEREALALEPSIIAEPVSDAERPDNQTRPTLEDYLGLFGFCFTIFPSLARQRSGS